jgi:hypothetical protein
MHPYGTSNFLEIDRLTGNVEVVKVERRLCKRLLGASTATNTIERFSEFCKMCDNEYNTCRCFQFTRIKMNEEDEIAPPRQQSDATCRSRFCGVGMFFWTDRFFLRFHTFIRERKKISCSLQWHTSTIVRMSAASLQRLSAPSAAKEDA